MRLQIGKTYVAFVMYDNGETMAWVRNAPEPPIALRPHPSFRDCQCYVYSIWPAAIRIDRDTLRWTRFFLPARITSLRTRLHPPDHMDWYTRRCFRPADNLRKVRAYAP